MGRAKHYSHQLDYKSVNTNKIRIKRRIYSAHHQAVKMSMLQLLTGLLDQHGDSAQQAALLAYLRQGEEAQPYLEAVLTARLAHTAYRAVSKEDQYEAARNETILSIAAWVKEHPRATQ